MKIKKYMFFIIFFSFSLLSFAQEYMVVVNKENTETKTSVSNLKKIFLGKKTTWNSGKKIIICTLKKGKIHTHFIKEIVKMSPTKYRMFWKKKLYTGTGKLPKSFKTTTEMMNFISKTPNSIGYIPTQDLKKDIVKALPIMSK